MKSEPINGLTIKTIKSETSVIPAQAVSAFDCDTFAASLAKFLTPAAHTFFVAYLDYRVIIGEYQDQQFVFYRQEPKEQIDPKYLQRLRVFYQTPNAEAGAELLLWRSGQTLKGRLRQDSEGEGTQVVEAKQVLFGTKKGNKNDAKFIEITEDRGTSLILPAEIGMQFDKDNKLCSRVCLVTRNYVGEIEVTHQATYVDCRFVRFTTM